MQYLIVDISTCMIDLQILSDMFHLNGDIAGLCARNDIDNFPWFSPAGTTRGSILNAVKLAYNPSQEQRDRLYSARVNPVIYLLVLVLHSSVIRLDLLRHPHLIESTFVVCSSILKMQFLQQQEINSLSSMMKSQELTL